MGVLVLLLVLLVTGGKQSQLLVLSLSLKFDKMSPHLTSTSRKDATFLILCEYRGLTGIYFVLEDAQKVSGRYLPGDWKVS